MGIIRKTFTFWLVIGIIAAVVVALVLPKLKTKVIEKIPGRDQAMQMVEQVKTAIGKHLSDKPVDVPKVEQNIEEEPEPQIVVQDSVKKRDEKLFKRQCAILDDLM
jgi:hypothetical protein